MARTRYAPQQIIVATGAGSPAVLTLSPAAPFRIYPTETGGSPYTDLTGSDGVTALPVNGSGFPFCDTSGVPPVFYGPDGVNGVLWLDSFAALPVRIPWLPSGVLHTLLTLGAQTGSVTQTFTGPTHFSSATASQFTVAPTVAGNQVAHSGNLAALLATSAVQIAYHNATGQPYYISIDPATGLWPHSGARVMPDGTSLSTLTAPLVWSSTSYAGAIQPTGFVTGDTWLQYQTGGGTGGMMLWSSTTATWWAYNPVTGAMVDGGPRPSGAPAGTVWYVALNDAAAPLPTGSQAPLPATANGRPGDLFLLHQNSTLWP